ncbi:hypothetical protein DHEL01_v209358 [Diaporthe helianthi]|uniref:Major facilitator superfamily (MFS) profile domain-containing protein n=1 Tax=Diaporthe helianthi TaxID=158607 RepID=A0A2P5HPT6_DIAHE|nr:hypothetical protein DHEL01_v209358 [Diaporthe helianthi]
MSHPEKEPTPSSANLEEAIQTREIQADNIRFRPYNWSQKKKATNLFLVAFHAMMATFTAAAIMAAFVNIAQDLEIEVQTASYLTSLFVLHSNLNHTPPCAFAVHICPAAAIGSGVVAETFFKNERAHYMGIWTIFVTLGVPVAPFIFGFVALRVGYRWIYYILAITNGVQLVLYFFFGPESRYIRGSQPPRPEDEKNKSDFKKQYMSFRRIDKNPMTWYDFVEPLVYAARPCVMLPAVAYAMEFLWTSIMTTVEIPQLFPELFGFNTQQNGLQMISVIVGTIVGEQIGGRMSDVWMSPRRKKLGGRSPEPEYRLWLSFFGFLLCIFGVIIFLVQLYSAGHSWNVTPLVGVGIAAAGNQVVTTVLVTYAVDCYRQDASSVGVFITFVRQMWGFIGPFCCYDIRGASSKAADCI